MLKKLNGRKNGVFTVVIDGEHLAIVGNFPSGAKIVYFKELDKVYEIIEDIKAFGFEVELDKKFKILFDKENEKVVMTSKEICDKLFSVYLSGNGITPNEYDEVIEMFRDNGRYEIIVI